MRIRTKPFSHLPARRGLTLVELCMGLVVTAMVGTAVASFSLAVTEGWYKSQQAQAQAVTATQASARMKSNVEGTCYVASTSTDDITTSSGSGNARPDAWMFLWQSDDWNSAADGKAQVGEMLLLTWSRSTRTVYVSEVDRALATSTTYSADASRIMTTSEMSSADTPGTFMRLGFVKARRPILGQGRTEAEVTANSATGTDVTAASFRRATRGGGESPGVVYSLQLTRGSDVQTVQGTITLRSSKTPN
jgi:hypothetical protein